MAADIPVLIGETRYLQLVDETVWGTVPGSPVWVDVPVTEYDVRFKPARRSGQARVGRYQNSYGANVSGHPSGKLTMPLYGWEPTGLTTSLMQHILEWGFLDQEVDFPRSKAAQWMYAGHGDDKGHTGLRVDQITVAGSESGVTVSIDLVGKVATNFSGSGSPPTTRNKLVEVLFPDCTFSLGGTNLPMSSFQWTAQRSLNPIYLNSASPLSCPKGDWKETFSVTPLKTAATYDALRDALGMPEAVGVLVLKGLHNGTGATGNWTVCTTTFNRLSLIDSDESGGTGAVMNPLTYDVLKPDTSANGSVMVFTEAA